MKIVYPRHAGGVVAVLAGVACISFLLTQYHNSTPRADEAVKPTLIKNAAPVPHDSPPSSTSAVESQREFDKTITSRDETISRIKSSKLRWDLWNDLYQIDSQFAYCLGLTSKQVQDLLNLNRRILSEISQADVNNATYISNSDGKLKIEIGAYPNVAATIYDSLTNGLKEILGEALYAFYLENAAPSNFNEILNCGVNRKIIEIDRSTISGAYDLHVWRMDAFPSPDGKTISEVCIYETSGSAIDISQFAKFSISLERLMDGHW